jgi:predicted nucleotidyltransferase
MVLDIDPADVRHQRDLETVEYDLYRYAAELAVLDVGEVESARNIVGILYEEEAPTGQLFWADWRLMVAWKSWGLVTRKYIGQQKL